MRRCVGLFLSLLVIAAVQTESADEPILNWRYDGSRAEGARFVKIMEDHRVQELLLSVAVEPREPSFVAKRLKGSGIEARDLEGLRLLQQVGGRYVIRFPLLTRSDLDRIRTVAEDEGPGLAAAMLTRRSEIEAALARTPQNGVDPEAVAYFAVGCVSLDWDGLALTRARGYRTEPKEDAPYLPIAWQIEGGGSKRGLYWGSHNFNDTITFTTFGDHAGRPRVAFPDLGNQIRRGIQTTNAPEQVTSRLGWIADDLIRRHLGLMMIALRDGEKALSELAAGGALSESEAKSVLDLAVQLHYVTVDDETYQAAIPVLTEVDAPMLREVRGIGREVMGAWFDERYDALRAELSDLGFVRHGVPLEDGFYWVWHYLFGVANRELAAAGLFIDPYGPASRFEGFLPVVWLGSVTIE